MRQPFLMLNRVQPLPFTLFTLISKGDDIDNQKKRNFFFVSSKMKTTTYFPNLSYFSQIKGKGGLLRRLWLFQQRNKKMIVKKDM